MVELLLYIEIAACHDGYYDIMKYELCCNILETVKKMRPSLIEQGA